MTQLGEALLQLVRVHGQSEEGLFSVSREEPEDLLARRPELGQDLGQLLGLRLDEVLVLLAQEPEDSQRLMRLVVYVLTLIEGTDDVLQTISADETRSFDLVQDIALQGLIRRQGPVLIPFLRHLVLNDAAHDRRREEALEALVTLGDTGSLRVLQMISEARPRAWSSPRHVLHARARLGDVTATRALIWHQFEGYGQPWPAQSLEALQGRLGGLMPLVSEMVALNPEWIKVQMDDLSGGLEALSSRGSMADVRWWATEHLSRLAPDRAPGLFLARLKDPNWLVLKGASDALASLPSPPLQELHKRVTDQARARSERLWAARTLLLLGERPDLSGIAELRIELDGPLSEDARKALVRFWMPNAERGTDVRWYIEALSLPQAHPAPDVSHEHAQVVAALRAQGLMTSEPVPSRTHTETGWGTYALTEVEGKFLELSDLARYAMVSGSDEDDFDAPTAQLVDSALMSVGWTRMTDDLMDVMLTGFVTSRYGHRGEFRVINLLFFYET